MMLAVLVIIAALLTSWATWHRWRLRQRLPQAGGANWHLWLAQVLLLLALGCIGAGARKTRIDTSCIAFLLDCSESMRAEGVGAQNRLKEGRAAIKRLASSCHGCDVALITYAGTAFVDCPPTSDHAAFEAALEAAGPGVLYQPGSAPEQAVRQADALGASVMVLVSDGEMNSPNGASVAIWRTRKTPLVAICCGAMGIPRQIPRKNGVLYDEATGQPALTTTTTENVVQASALSDAPFGGVSEATGSLEEASAFLQKHVGTMASPRRHLLYAIVLLFLALSVEPLVRYMRDSNWVKKPPRELIKADVSFDVSNAAERRDRPREGARHRIALGSRPQGAKPGNVEMLRYLRPGRAPHYSCYIVAPCQGAWTILHSIP
ncbi:MAG: VWA domain-containing protein, partial [Victivallales bacterium]|nr:VWA domain-containing protein [Victivallales bacterium]